MSSPPSPRRGNPSIPKIAPYPTPARLLSLAEKGITKAEKQVVIEKLAVKAAKVELKKAERSLDYWRLVYQECDAAIDAAKKEKANERSNGNGREDQQRRGVVAASTRHPWRKIRGRFASSGLADGGGAADRATRS